MKLLLVHGASHDETCWDFLLPFLIKRGIDVYVLTLSGHGKNRTIPYRVTMSMYANDVCTQAKRIGSPCILAGHSMGGYVITAAAEKRPDLFEQLIYLTAYVPEQRGSCLAFQERKYQDKLLSRAVKLSLMHGTVSISKEDAACILYNQCPPEIQAEAVNRLCPQPVRPSLSRVRWSNERLGSVPKDYIECTLDNAISIDTQRSLQRNMNFSRILTLESDHSPFFSMPEKLADNIRELIR